MQVRAVVLAAALALAPLDTRAADLVVWWEKGFYPEEDAAVAELVAAFERKTGKQVEFVRHSHVELPARVRAAIEAGGPPDFLWGTGPTTNRFYQWAHEDRLADLAGAVGLLRDLFDADALDDATLPDGRTGGRGLYALPMARQSHHLHVWWGLLERAGFTLEDIPQGWEAFWSFWCDRVQPAVRDALGRDDVWAVGLPVSSWGTTPTPRSSSSSGPSPRTGRRRPAGAWRARRRRGPSSSGRSRPTRRSTRRAAPRPTRRAGPTSATTRRSWRGGW